MVNEKMRQLGSCRSAIREIFEYGKKRTAQVGAENVFDLINLGNVIPKLPVLDIQIDIKPSDIFLLPSIHIDVKMDIRFPW